MNKKRRKASMSPVLLDWNQRYELIAIYTHTHTHTHIGLAKKSV